MSLPQVVTTAENRSYSLSRVQVWVMPPVAAKPDLGRAGGFLYPWDWGLWQPEERLIPKRATRSVGSTGTAEFRLLRTRRTDSRVNRPQGGSDNVIEGAWVAITYRGQDATSALMADPSDSTPNPRKILDPSRVLWWGYITTIAGEVIKGSTDLVGSVNAQEVGTLLDRQQIYGWQRSVSGSPYGEVMTNPPTANIATGTMALLGNAIAGTDASGNSVYLFARNPADCGTADANLWSRDRLLKHIIQLCRPYGLPRIALAYDQAAINAFLDDRSAPEIYELRNLTWKGAFDLLVPSVRCLGWYLAAGTSGWTLHLFSYADTNAYGLLPQNSPTDVQLGALSADGTNDPIDALGVTFTQEDVPDEVVIEGNPCVFAGSVSKGDGNLINGWTAAQLSAYLAGASKNLDGSTNSAYNPLSENTKKMLNAAIRASSSLGDVFTRFLLQSDALQAPGDLRVANPAGTGAGARVPLCPTLTWSGGTLTAQASSSPPYLPTAQVLRTIPWAEGVKSDGTDTRDAKSKAAPQFLPLRVFRYDSTLSPKWRDQVAENGRPALPSFSVEPDDHGPGVRIRFSPPEILAQADWTAAAAIADIDPRVTGGVTFDWRQLVLTLAVEGDQRVRVAKRRQVYQADGSTRDVTDGEVRTRLVIAAPDLNCWIMAPGTILGLLATGEPDVLTATTNIGLGYYATRNDFPTAERRARQAAAWLFRRRTAISLNRARPDALPAWAQLGYMIGYVRDSVADGSQVSLQANTAVTAVSFSFDDTPRVSVSTDLPAMPTFPMMPGAGGGGGSVSASLSGSVPQAVARIAGPAALAIDRDTQRLPVHVPRNPLPSQLLMLTVIDGEIVYNDGTNLIIYGIRKTFGTITSVGTQYDPTGDDTPGAFTSTDHGIGRGYLWQAGVENATPVLILLDSSSPIPQDLWNGDVVWCDTVLTVMGPTGPLTVYVCKML